MAAPTAPPNPENLTVPSELAGKRLDVALAALLPDLSRSGAGKLLKEGAVTAGGKPAKASDKAEAGQTLTLTRQTNQLPDIQAEDIPLDVVFEDEYLLVVNKPPDMVVHPAKGHHDSTLVNALLGHCTLSTHGEDFRPGIVHRLDQHTSGLLLVAKTDSAHRGLSRQVEAHEARRAYQALCWGVPDPPTGVVRTQLGRHPQHRTQMAVLPEAKGRAAVTHYQVREAYAWSWQAEDGQRPRQRTASLIECVLETGRTHQIRVHLAHLGCPLLGDPLYGDALRDREGPAELLQLIAALPGQALHAAKLRFVHPITAETLEVQAKPPVAFTALLEWLRRHPATL